MKDLFAKYDVQVPRYTSYPTVPSWDLNLTSEAWIAHLQKTMAEAQSTWSLYVHIPFCETLCTFCGCNTIISRTHDKEGDYIKLLLKEWSLYVQHLPIQQKKLRHVHLGGGTPTFLSAASLDSLFKQLFSQILFEDGYEASIEVDPRRIKDEQLDVLRAHGFRRISLGVQDFNPEVQRLVNRIQPYAMTEELIEKSRKRGFDSVNLDLIYGLAAQTPDSMRETAELTMRLRPDRIALYSFAKVPWIKPQHRLFKDEDIPQGEEKRRLYEISREIFHREGYVEIGMDHFALPTDSLAIAQTKKGLHRNFMGYTDQKTDVLLALGVSGISESPFSFHQNEKLLPKYQERLAKNEIPSFRGHQHNAEDLVRRKQILEFITHYETHLEDDQIPRVEKALAEMLNDGLVERSGSLLRLTTKGLPFLRNACAALDERLQRSGVTKPTYSKAL